MPRIIPIQDLKDTLKDTSAISQMYNESKEPIFITQNRHGGFYAKLAQAEDDIHANKTVNARNTLHLGVRLSPDRL